MIYSHFISTSRCTINISHHIPEPVFTRSMNFGPVSFLLLLRIRFFIEFLLKISHSTLHGHHHSRRSPLDSNFISLSAYTKPLSVYPLKSYNSFHQEDQLYSRIQINHLNVCANFSKANCFFANNNT